VQAGRLDLPAASEGGEARETLRRPVFFVLDARAIAQVVENGGI